MFSACRCTQKTLGPIFSNPANPTNTKKQTKNQKGTFDRDNGGGFLCDHVPEATKAVWHFDGVYASSRHIPGVRFAGLIHPGLIGTAPSAELLKIWNDREGALVEAGPEGTTLGGVLHTRPLACLPEARGACLGSIKEGSAEWARVAAEAARTVPGRENGGCVVFFGVCVCVCFLLGHRCRVASADYPLLSPTSTSQKKTEIATSKTSRAAAAFGCRPSSRAPTSAWATCTSARATARSPSAARSR